MKHSYTYMMVVLLIGMVVDTFANMTQQNIHDSIGGMPCPSGGCHGY